MVKSLSQVIIDKSKRKFALLIVVPILTLILLGYLTLSELIINKTKELSHILTKSTLSHLANNDWKSAFDNVDSAIKNESLIYFKIFSKNEIFFGPFGEKSFLGTCVYLHQENITTEACSETLSKTAFYRLILSIALIILISFLVLETLKNEVIQSNETEIRQLSKIKAIDAFDGEGFLTDIKEFREVENHVKSLVTEIADQTRKLEKSSAANSFLHDIRSPLNIITNDFLPNNKINESIALINNILERAESNLNLSTYGNISLASIKSVLEELKNTPKYANTFFEMSSPDFDIWAGCNHIEILYIVQNFINNSIEAVSLIGKENIRIKIGVYLKDQWVQIIFEDNGPGASLEILNELNDGKKVASSKNEGKGIGLHNIQTYLKGVGGRIEFFSEKDKGFKIELRLRSYSNRESGFTIYHVEDDKYIRRDWASSAELAGVSLKSMSPEQFLTLDKSIYKMGDMFFLDVDLGITSGLKLAKDLAKNGHKEIYLTTGSLIAKEDYPHYIKGAIGKRNPWGASRK